MTEKTFRYIPLKCTEHDKILMYTHWDYECPAKGCKVHVTLESVYRHGPQEKISDKDPNDDR